MTTQAFPRPRMDQRDSKEEALAVFVRSYLEAEQLAGEELEIMLMALSTKSPVVSALQSVYSSLAGNPKLRLILATLPHNDPAEDMSCFAPVEIRWAANPRFLDAHEQLVLGTSASWTGDCMRRDPHKRDAFQSFNRDCLESAGWARICFDRIWEAADPLAVIDACSSAAPEHGLCSEMPMPEHIDPALADWDHPGRDRH